MEMQPLGPVPETVPSAPADPSAPALAVPVALPVYPVDQPTRVVDDRYPGFWQALGLIGVALLLQFGVAMIIVLAGFIAGLKIDRHPGVIAAANLIGIGLVVAWGVFRSGAPARAVLPLKPIRPWLFVPITLSVLGMGILLSEVDNLFRIILPVPDFVARLFGSLVGGEVSLWGSLAALVIVAPLTEELFFRGLILRGFLRRYGVATAIVISSLLFALMHLNPWQFFSAGSIGIVFAWWFVRTGSLVPGLFGHALNNALPLLLTHVVKIEIPGFTGPFDAGVTHQPLCFDLLGLVLAAFGVWLFARVCARPAPATVASGPRGGSVLL